MTKVDWNRLKSLFDSKAVILHEEVEDIVPREALESEEFWDNFFNRLEEWGFELVNYKEVGEKYWCDAYVNFNRLPNPEPEIYASEYARHHPWYQKLLVVLLPVVKELSISRIEFSKYYSGIAIRLWGDERSLKMLKLRRLAEEKGWRIAKLALE